MISFLHWKGKLNFMYMIRIILVAAVLMSVVTVKAQSPLSFGAMNGMQPSFRQFNYEIDTSKLQKKWFLTKYAGISAGVVGFNGTAGTFLSAPIGLQLNRQLTNNVFAFAGISAMVAYSPYLSSSFQPAINKNNGFMNVNRFGTYSAANVGMMYINNERTFSISGSIGVSRNDFNNYSPFYAPATTPGVRNNKAQF